MDEASLSLLDRLRDTPESESNEERIVGDNLAQTLVVRETRSGFEIEM